MTEKLPAKCEKAVSKQTDSFDSLINLIHTFLVAMYTIGGLKRYFIINHTS
jgi:hypothetical protein